MHCPMKPVCAPALPAYIFFLQSAPRLWGPHTSAQFCGSGWFYKSLSFHICCSSSSLHSLLLINGGITVQNPAPSSLSTPLSHPSPQHQLTWLSYLCTVGLLKAHIGPYISIISAWDVLGTGGLLKTPRSAVSGQALSWTSGCSF